MTDLRLPADLVDFLRNGLQLQYDFRACEAGRVSLLPLDSLKLGTFTIDADRKENAHRDPNRGKPGMYKVPGVNLIATAQGYDPEGILIWVPDEAAFGTWDCDHHDLWIFRDTEWSEIVADPLPYITAQWTFDGIEKEWLIPWPRYPFDDDPLDAGVPPR